jgi:hypothetical protein
MIRHGILFSGSQFISLSHQDAEITQTIEAYARTMQVLRFALHNQAVDALTLGAVNEPVFRR